MAYQGYQNGQTNVNYGADFNAFPDAGFGNFLDSVPGTGVDNAFYGSTISDLDFLAPLGMPTQDPSPLTFPHAPVQQQQVYGTPMNHMENNGNFLHNGVSLSMPMANQAVQGPTSHPSTFYPQQAPPVAPRHGPTQAAHVSVTGTANGPSLASGSNASPLGGRPRFTPSHAPGTPVVLDPWKYYRTAAERQQLKLKDGKIPRITRKKKGEHVDPEQYYGPPVKTPEAWGPIDPKTKRPVFEYTKYGELHQGRQFDVAQLKMYLYDRRLKTVDPSNWVPRTKLDTERRVEGKMRSGLTLWLGWPAAQADHRYPRNPGTQTCRYKDCPYSTIKQGLPRVIFDERMNDQGLELDPFYNAGYIHLYCLEKNFDLVNMIKDLDFRIDDRSFKKEEYNLFSLTGRDGKLDLTNTYHYWWKHQFRLSQQAKAHGRSRDRSNYEESSLGAALLKCKLSHESSARAKTRLDRDGVDVTKYWGDLDLYSYLRHQQKTQKDRAEDEGEGPSHKHEQNRAAARPRSRRSVQAAITITPDAGNTFAYPQYPDSHMHYAQQQQQQQYAGYGMAAAAPASHGPQMVATHQVSHHDMQMLNQPFQQMLPAQPAVAQWAGTPLPQPSMAVPTQVVPQQLVSPQGRKRSREEVNAEDESLGGAVMPEVEETTAKKACHNHRDSHAPPYGVEEHQAWDEEAADQENQGDFEVMPQELKQESQKAVMPDGIPSFDFTLPEVAEEQTIDDMEAELGSEAGPQETNDLPDHDGKSANTQMEEEEVSAPPEWSTDEQLLNSDDVFDSNITPDEFDTIFGKEDTTTPAATEEPDQEASSDHSKDLEEEEPKVPEEAAKESSTPASPKPSSPSNSAPGSPARSPKSPPRSPSSGLSSSRWA